MIEDKQQVIQALKREVSTTLDLKKELSDEEIEEHITQVVCERDKGVYLSLSEKQGVIRYIFNAMRRLDVIQPLLDDPDITEIMANGPNDIFIEKEGKMQQLQLGFESQQRLEDVIQVMVSKMNRVVNDASPIVDSRLQDGSRVNVVLPPVSLNGPLLTIRKFSRQPLTMGDLIARDTVSEQAARVLEILVRAKYNIFICGGTGSGKTTFLNVLSNFIPSDERIITIEDSAELQITHVPNTVRLETRNPNTEGKGQITVRDLIKTSLRMRPDRIVVGEVRGAEALDMLQAMNTGHDGSLSTGHANSSQDMLSRLETMVLCGASFPLEAIRQQIASALDILVFMGRLRDKSRRVLEISEVEGYHAGAIKLNPLFLFREAGDSSTITVNGSLVRTDRKLVHDHKLRLAGLIDQI